MINKIKSLNNVQKSLVCLFVLNFFLRDLYCGLFDIYWHQADNIQIGVGIVSILGIFLFKSKG